MSAIEILNELRNYKPSVLVTFRLRISVNLLTSAMQLHIVNLFIIVVTVSLGVTGCAKILEDQGELERVEATFFYDSTSVSVPSAYAVELSEQRIIRRIVIHSLDRIRNTDIYVRVGKDKWLHTKQIKGWIEGATTFNIRARGDAVRVIPKSDALRVIQDVEVFAVPKKN